jgi:hypothetical protein
MAIRRWVFQGAEAHFVDEGTFPSHRANLALLPLDESHFDACPLRQAGSRRAYKQQGSGEKFLFLSQ